MHITRLRILSAATFFLAACPAYAQDYAFTTIADPLGVGGTYVDGISGNNIVGNYVDAAGNSNGFIYNSGTFTTIDDPMGSNTYVTGVSGNLIVGEYVESNGAAGGFIYNGSTFQSPTDSTGFWLNPTGISGNAIVGTGPYYSGVTTSQIAFLYNITTSSLTALSLPYQNIEHISIEGYTLGGTYIDGSLYNPASVTYHGFFYNGSIYTDINDPLVQGSGNGSGTAVNGISGNKVVGAYAEQDGQTDGYLYSNGQYTTIDDPLGDAEANQAVTGIDGNNLVGIYEGEDGIIYGYEATAVPEPRELWLGLICTAGLTFLRFARSHYRSHPSKDYITPPTPAAQSQ